jgi:hypothetical protein
MRNISAILGKAKRPETLRSGRGFGGSNLAGGKGASPLKGSYTSLMSFGSLFCVEGSLFRFLPAEPRGEVSWSDKNPPSLMIQTPNPKPRHARKTKGRQVSPQVRSPKGHLRRRRGRYRKWEDGIGRKQKKSGGAIYDKKRE